MGASSSGLLDEAKVTHIKGLTDSMLQSFGVFYRQQYSAAHIIHLHQEVEPKKEGRGLLLTHRPRHAPEEVLYQGSVQFSCWEEQGRRCRERYTVLRGDYRMEIHDSMETFSRGCAARLVLHPAGGTVLTTKEESSALLDQLCPGILNGVKEDSSSMASAPGVFPVFLHLPYTGHTCFQFTQEGQRDDFLSALKTCIRHQNLDPWRESSYESQAFVRAIRLYRQDRGCYEFWEMLLGTEEQVLASQVMEEVLPWLQTQLQSRVKGKRSERMRQWMATVQASHTLVVEQLIGGLEALKGACRQTASANQALIRSNLDQITASRCFLEDKLRACICTPAEKLCSESIAPYLSSILDELTEHISGGIQGIQHTLHTQMDAALTHTHGGPEGLEKALLTLRSTSLDRCYRLVENLTEKRQDLKQRFRSTNTQRLVHSAHIEMEQLLDGAVYTLELFLQSSARLQPSQIAVKTERAKERVLKQLDHDSRVVQRRLYQEALLEITLPALTRDMDNTWKPELQQFEQYIFSDYSSFILVQNVYDDVLRDILSKEIERVVQEAANQKSNHLLLDSSDLAISQYSLIGQTPPRSAPGSPATHVRDSSSVVPSRDRDSTPPAGDGGQSRAADLCPPSDPKPDPKSGPSPVVPSPVIVVTQQSESTATKASVPVELCGEARLETDTTAVTPSSDSAVRHDRSSVPESPSLSPIAPNPLVTPPSTPPSTVAPSECVEADRSAPTKAEPPASDIAPEAASPLDESTPNSNHQPSASSLLQSPSSPSPSHPLCPDGPMRTSLVSLSAAVACDSSPPSVGQTVVQQVTDRAVYLRGGMKEDREVEREKEEKEEEEKWEGRKANESIEGEEGREAGNEREKKKMEKGEEKDERQMEGIGLDQTGGRPDNHGRNSSKIPAESATASTHTIDQGEEEGERGDQEEEGGKLKGDRDEDKEKGDDEEKGGKAEEEGLQSPQPMASQPESADALLLDSVAVIRGLVTEVIEVVTVVHPPSP